MNNWSSMQITKIVIITILGILALFGFVVIANLLRDIKNELIFCLMK